MYMGGKERLAMERASLHCRRDEKLYLNSMYKGEFLVGELEDYSVIQSMPGN